MPGLDRDALVARHAALMRPDACTAHRLRRPRRASTSTGSWRSAALRRLDRARRAAGRRCRGGRSRGPRPAAGASSSSTVPARPSRSSASATSACPRRIDDFHAISVAQRAARWALQLAPQPAAARGARLHVRRPLGVRHAPRRRARSRSAARSRRRSPCRPSPTSWPSSRASARRPSEAGGAGRIARDYLVGVFPLRFETSAQVGARARRPRRPRAARRRARPVPAGRRRGQRGGRARGRAGPHPSRAGLDRHRRRCRPASRTRLRDGRLRRGRGPVGRGRTVPASRLSGSRGRAAVIVVLGRPRVSGAEPRRRAGSRAAWPPRSRWPRPRRARPSSSWAASATTPRATRRRGAGPGRRGTRRAAARSVGAHAAASAAEDAVPGAAAPRRRGRRAGAALRARVSRPRGRRGPRPRRPAGSPGRRRLPRCGRWSSIASAGSVRSRTPCGERVTLLDAAAVVADARMARRRSRPSIRRWPGGR